MKIMQLNAENLAIHFDKKVPSDFNTVTDVEWQACSISQQPNKPLKKTFGLADAIMDEFPDVIALCEVMGPDSLKNFNKYFLENKYNVLYNNTNSKRGIDLAFLVKKDLPDFKFNIFSHKHRKVLMPNGDERFFSRDIAELQVFKNGDLAPSLIVLSVHLKSQLSSEGDFQGQNSRQAELISLVNLFLELEQKYPDTKILLVGDFNGNVTKEFHDPEFKYLYENTDLADTHELKGSSQEDKTSHVYFNVLGDPNNQQLDYIFLNKHAKAAVDLNLSYAYRYKHFGYPWPLIKTMKEKWELPSDHYPQVVEINL